MFQQAQSEIALYKPLRTLKDQLKKQLKDQLEDQLVQQQQSLKQVWFGSLWSRYASHALCNFVLRSLETVDGVNENQTLSCSPYIELRFD